MKVTAFLIAISLVLLSCGKEEDPMPTAAGLVGQWSITSLDYSGSSSTTVAGITVSSQFTGVGKNMDMTVTFNENPNTVVSEGSYTIALTTTTAGQTETEDIDFDSIVNDGTWALDGKTLIVTGSGETQQATVTKLTDTTLTLKIDATESESAGGITISYKIKGVYTLTKM